MLRWRAVATGGWGSKAEMRHLTRDSRHLVLCQRKRPRNGTAATLRPLPGQQKSSLAAAISRPDPRAYVKEGMSNSP